MKVIKEYNIAVFASGTGTNTANLIRYFSSNKSIRIRLVVSNKAEAGVLNIAQQAAIDTLIINKERFFSGDHYLPLLEEHNIDFIILAGFLWKVPDAIVKAHPRKIINIHPALLPLYGGKGMYGNFVHEAVIKAGETKSGITIHYVDEIYDNGEVILQVECEVTADDTAESLAKKIHALEYEFFPKAIEKVIEEAE